MMSLFRRLSPLLLLVALLPAQEDRLSEREAEMERRIRERAEQGGRLERGKVDPTGKEESEEDLKSLTPEERLARNVRHNASSFCRFVAAVKPSKLMPGQSGTVMVSALLSGQAVLPAPAPVEMIGSPQQGVATLGNLTVRPAEPGSLATAYNGRPVYDNYAIFEIPVTISGDAVVGTKQTVGIDLRFDIYDGASAQPIGRFIDRVTAEVEIGRSAEVAHVQRASDVREDPASVPDTAAPAASDAVPPSPAPAEDAQRVIAGSEPPADVQPPAVPDEPAAGTEVDTDWSKLREGGGTSSWLVWAGGGVLLLVLVLMLARRR